MLYTSSISYFRSKSLMYITRRSYVILMIRSLTEQGATALCGQTAPESLIHPREKMSVYADEFGLFLKGKLFWWEWFRDFFFYKIL